MAKSMAEADLFETILEALPEKAYHLRAWLALLRCFTRIERTLMQHIAQEFNSSLPRYDVLTALILNPDGLTMGELAAMLRVSKGNITGVVRRLKVDGLVKKVTSRQDRRIQSVTILPAGKELWERMNADYERIISRLLSGQADKDIVALTAALEKTLASVNEIDG